MHPAFQSITPPLVLRRFGATLSGLLLLLFQQVGSGTLCARDAVMSRADDATNETHATMPRGAPAPEVTTLASIRDAAPVAGGCDEATAPSHCLPRESGPCATVMTCNPMVAALSATVVERRGTRATADLPEPLFLYSSVVHAPELPPPRA